MINLEAMIGSANTLTPVTVALVALAGVIVGIAPSSFPLLSVAAGLAAGRGAADGGERRLAGLWLSTGFVLGIATVDAVLGAAFGLAGFVVLRVLVSYLPIIYILLAALLAITGLALLRVIHIVLPVLTPQPKQANTFVGSYLLGLPFGLSTCPACTPLLLPVVATASATGDPVLGAVLMGTFGLARGVPVLVIGTLAGSLAHLGRTRPFIRWAERSAAALMLIAAVYFLYQAAYYAGWITVSAA